MKKLLKTIKTLACCLIIGTQVQAQNSHWILAPKYSNLSMITPLPTPIGGYNGDAAQYAQNMQMNADGDILFNVIDNKVFDGEGILIGELQRPFSGLSGDYCTFDIKGSELVIIPDPSNCLKYYIISYAKTMQNCAGNQIASRIFYSIMDFSLSRPGNPNKMGKLSDMQELLSPGYTLMTGGDEGVLLAASTIRNNTNGNLRYLFFSNNYKGGIVRFKIDNNGMNYDGFIPFPNGIDQQLRSEMELIDLPNGHFRIAVPYLTTNFTHNNKTVYSCIYTAELDATGQVYNNQEKIFYFYRSTNTNKQPVIHGLEFSPNGSKLFISHEISQHHPRSLEYYDFSSPNSSDPNGNGIYNLNIGSANNEDFQFSQIEYGINQKMYFGAEGRLASLNNPNNPSGNTLLDNSITIPGYTFNTGGVVGATSFYKLYSLPDQIDGMDYNELYESNLTCCTDNRTYQILSYSANSGTWNGSSPVAPGLTTIYIKKELRVPAGVNLIIKNMNLKFAPGARLIIENGVGTQQGGKLTLNNTLLTIDERCGSNSMWLGVEVWGNTTASQGTLTNSTQGVLKIENNSKIEHANVGVLLSKRMEFFGSPMIDNYDNNRNGGIVSCTSSNFFNCETGILFQNYNNGLLNLTTITNTTFSWNGTFKNPNAKPKYHIQINSRSNITVRSSNFYQQTPSIYSNPTHLGYGIYAVNSTFYVYSSCNNLTLPIGQDCPDANTIPSKFENLYMGVRVINSDSKPFTVLRNQFTNCHYGVHSLSAKNQNISRNKMTVHASANEATGIYVSEGTGYRIEENIIEGYNTISSGNQSYGILIDNSGELHNELYKNTLSKLYVGTQAQRINGKIQGGQNDNTTGLQFICNAYNYPIRLADIGVNGRVDKEQGTTNSLSNIAEARAKAARNTFSMYAENQTTYPDHDIMLYPGSQGIQYVHLNANSHKPDNYSTLGGGADVVPVLQMYAGLPVAPETNTCPTRYGSTGTGIIFEPLGKSAKIDSLNNLIDGGDKQNLLNLIASTPKSEETYHNLIEASPYLSDEVLVAYIKSSASDVQVKEVLIANSGLSTEVSELLEKSKRTNALKSDLRMYKDKKSEFRRLKSDIKALEIELHAEQRISISNILDDTTNSNSTEKLINYLKLCRGIEFKQMLLNQYMYQRNYDEFSSLLNELSDKIPSDMVEYYRFQYDFNDNNGIADEALMSRLKNFANGDESKQSAKEAKLLLQILNGEEPEIEILPLQASSKSMMISQSEDQESIKFTETTSVKLFPNPSNGIVTITLADLEVSNAVIQLVDLTGKEVFNTQVSKTSSTQVDLSHLKKGTYLIKVAIDQLEPYTQLLRLE